MTVDPGLDVTQLLGAWQAGEEEAFEQLVEVVYEELHEIASRQLTGERPDHTLQATGLVHEAYLRLAGHDRARWHGRLHFFAVAARVMRRVLVDHARGRKSLKRGGHLRKISLTSGVEVSGEGPEDLLEVDEALSRLEELDPELSQVVELRFFAGFTHREVAELLGVSVPTIVRRWRTARGWLYQYLNGGA